MKKILIINTIGFGYEGISSVIINYIENMNHEELEFYFAAFENKGNQIKNKLGALGKVIAVPSRKKNIRKYMASLNHLLKSRFDVVHIHGNSGTMAIETCLCKINKVKKIIIHCHSTHTDYPILNRILKGLAIKQADLCLACSVQSGNWLYGKHEYMVLNNGIPLDKYKFNAEYRREIRDELNIEDECVIGHVGYFSEVKNQSFLVDIFKIFHEKNTDSKLLLIGKGSLQSEIEEKVKELKLEDAVIFTGSRTDVEKLYQAMDIFVLPSLWEGLSLVTIEAQAAGLPVFVSDAVSTEAGCTPLFRRLSLQAGVEYWAEEISEMSQKESKRMEDYFNWISEKGFDIKTEAHKLREIYMSIEA